MRFLTFSKVRKNLFALVAFGDLLTLAAFADILAFMANNPFALFAVAVAGLVSIMGFAILDTEKFIKTAL